MKISNLRYYISQALRSIIHNGLMSLTSLFTVVCCLIILGLFLTITINVNYMANQIQDQCEIQAYIKKDIPDTELPKIGAAIKQIPNIKEAVLVDKAEALEYMRSVLNDSADILDGYEKDNPLPNSYKITLTDLSAMEPVVVALNNIDAIDSITKNQEVMDNILLFTGAVKNVSLWIMVLLSVVSIFIIANTIKLAVFARRKEINVMKFVGATNWFIRWPFVFEGIIIGTVGGLLAFGLVSWGYTSIFSAIVNSGLQMDLFQLKSYYEIWHMILASFLLLGTIIGAAGSSFAIRKHLQV